MFILTFHVPKTHLEVVKNAVFAAGAGKMDNYSHCAWQTLGEGQFLPLTGSHAFIGESGKLEKIAEYKVEMVCDEKNIKDVIAALKQSHPYEVPSYQVCKIEQF